MQTMGFRICLRAKTLSWARPLSSEPGESCCSVTLSQRAEMAVEAVNNCSQGKHSEPNSSRDSPRDCTLHRGGTG